MKPSQSSLNALQALAIPKPEGPILSVPATALIFRKGTVLP